eukprot:Colp12_sorted_trinity150504_noHs@31124
MLHSFRTVFALLFVLVLCEMALSFRVSLGHASRPATKFFGKGGTIPRSDDKVRVELFEDVERIGLKGDIVKVSKEQWMNILLPKKVSKVVHDFEVDKIDRALLAMAHRKADERNELMKCITELPILELKENAGRNLKLYEPVSGKRMFELVKKQLDPKQVAKMTVKEVGLEDILLYKEDTKKFVPFNFKTINEIRMAGLYKVTLKMKATEELVHYQVRIIPTVPDILM